MGTWAMFQYVVDAALGSNADEVWISTDSDEVEELAVSMKKFETERLYVHRRTETRELEPEAGVVEVAECLILQQNFFDIKYDNYMLEMTSLNNIPDNDYTIIALANCPEIKSDELTEAFRMLEREECDEVRSYFAYRFMSLRENGIWGMKTRLIFDNPFGHLSAYVGGILTGATEIETKADFDWVLNVMTKRGRLHAD